MLPVLNLGGGACLRQKHDLALGHLCFCWAGRAKDATHQVIHVQLCQQNISKRPRSLLLQIWRKQSPKRSAGESHRKAPVGMTCL